MPKKTEVRCRYCRRRLKDAESVERGYGPVCARYNRMEWHRMNKKKKKKERKMVRLTSWIVEPEQPILVPPLVQPLSVK